MWVTLAAVLAGFFNTPQTVDGIDTAVVGAAALTFRVQVDVPLDRPARREGLERGEAWIFDVTHWPATVQV